MKRAIAILLIALAANAACAQVTNPYHFGRTFVPVTYTSGAPTTYKVIMGAKALTGIVGPTNIYIRSNQTYATEYEGYAWGYESANAAWTSAFAIYPNYYSNYPTMTYDNAGWIKGTRQAYGDWGAFIWLLQNTISFTSSASSVYVSSSGATNTIASVLVGTLGDYCPQTVVTETGPIFNTNYPGSNTGTDEVFKADTTAYYKLVPFTYLGVNNDDSDADGVPDFADGYNLVATNSADDISTNDFFTPWPVQLSSNASPTQALISITYTASDPASVTVTTNGYTPATNGYFRLWMKQGSKARNKAAVTNGGDFIPSGTYAATALGFNATSRTVELFIEPINPTTNREIVIQVDPDGTNATKGFVCIDKINIALIAINFLGAQSNSMNSLAVARWEDSFNSGIPPTLKTNFIQSDVDRFFVRVMDPSMQGQGTNTISIRTITTERNGYSDNATTVSLTEQPSSSGIFLSPSMLLVSDSIDDAFSSDSLPDDSHDDQTHVTLATGLVHGEYRPRNNGWLNCTARACTGVVKSVAINAVIMRLTTNGTPVVDPATVEANLIAISERYSQAGIAVQWTITTNNPPPGVILSGGLQVRTNVMDTLLASEAHAPIEGCGTVSNTADIHIFYVDTVDVGGGAGTLGTAVAGYYYDATDDPYTFNAFVEGSSLQTGYPFVVAHELGHLLTDTAHTANAWNLMYPYADQSNSLVAAKRLISSQVQAIRSDSHVK